MTDTYQPPTTWSEMWDRPDPAPPLDQPGTTHSAKLHAQRRHAKEREARQARDLDQIDNMVQEQAEDEALVDVLHRRRLGSKIPAMTLALARRALARRGPNLTSAERMAANYLERS